MLAFVKSKNKIKDLHKFFTNAKGSGSQKKLRFFKLKLLCNECS